MRRVYAICLGLLLACSNIRNKGTYGAEVEFTNTVVTRGLPSVTRFLETQCHCADGIWSANGAGTDSESCVAAADWVFTVSSRWSWHHAMMRYNGSLTDTNPGTAPTIPPVSCTLPGVR